MQEGNSGSDVIGLGFVQDNLHTDYRKVLVSKQNIFSSRQYDQQHNQHKKWREKMSSRILNGNDKFYVCTLFS